MEFLNPRVHERLFVPALDGRLTVMADRGTHDRVLHGKGGDGVAVRLGPGDGYEIDVRVEEGVDDVDRARMGAIVENPERAGGTVVQVEELRPVLFGESEVAVRLEVLPGSHRSGVHPSGGISHNHGFP